MPRHSIIALALALLAAIAPILPALADDTALNEGAYGPEPVGGGFSGPESAIAMVEEHLEIAMGRHATDVGARFAFKNTLPVNARQLVGFPDIGAAQAEGNRRDPQNAHNWVYMPSESSGALEDMRTFVDGQPVESYLKFGYVDTTGPWPSWRAGTPQNGQVMAWHTVPVTFPPGKTVIVERRYRAPNGSDVLGQTIFAYIVHTGGVWHGPIRRLVADVALKDGLTVDQLAWGLSEQEGHPCYPDRSAWQVRDPRHLRLVWNDFEPRTDRTRARIYLASLPNRRPDGSVIPGR